jgi:phosphopantothenoylcysteine decarboxylase / phosphopantothenate---cysteine ligase
MAADVVVKAAAVADFRPASRSASKLKKDAGLERIELARNPDILAELGAAATAAPDRCWSASPPRPTTSRPTGGRSSSASRPTCWSSTTSGARTTGFAVDSNAVVILGRDGARVEVPLTSKAAVADRILDEVVARL